MIYPAKSCAGRDPPEGPGREPSEVDPSLQSRFWVTLRQV